MKLLLQRVIKASVTVGSEPVGSIKRGLVVLAGIANGDTEADVDFLSQKTINLRIFDDSQGRLNLSVLDIKGELLIISQFTLLADTTKGRRPSFIEAASPELADSLINRYVDNMRASGLVIATGRFRQHMVVEIYNDGPVTIMLDSRDKNAGKI